MHARKLSAIKTSISKQDMKSSMRNPKTNFLHSETSLNYRNSTIKSPIFKIKFESKSIIMYVNLLLFYKIIPESTSASCVNSNIIRN